MKVYSISLKTNHSKQRLADTDSDGLNRTFRFMILGHSQNLEVRGSNSDTTLPAEYYVIGH